MDHNVTRRDVLGCALGLALPAPRLQALWLEDDLSLVNVAGSNVLVVSGRHEAVLIGGGAPESARDLLRFIEPVVPTLINTHWHSAHTGVNERLGKRGAKIIAHENTKLWMQAAARPRSALPNATTYGSGEITCGRVLIRYVHLPQAHTDGDLYAFLPDANVLVTGDLLHVDRCPVIDYSTHGWIGGYLDATEALLQVADSQTRIVPGEGPVQTRAALEAQRALCKAVKTQLIESFRQGNSLEEFIASMPTYPAPFLTMAYRGALGHLYELIEGIV
jgi:glyoxylase-like metal-dependent hydrolase (beta-lactamase superfamily II)